MATGGGAAACFLQEMKIAVEGCSHGELDSIYADILEHERATSSRVDLVLLCGDFQAVRNPADLHCLAVPVKYRRLGDFHRYYRGEKVAPILTIVIGGNHEASNYMMELYYGGWLAPNIYYLGAAGSVRVGGVQISGASGIFKPMDYERGRYERVPYNAGDLRSVYHTRQFDIARLGLLRPPEVFLSHDWPNGVEQFGDVAALLKRKPFFRKDVESHTLGSPPLWTLLCALKPRYWFSAHLHVRYAAHVPHVPHRVPPPAPDNPEALDISDDDFDTPAAPSGAAESAPGPSPGAEATEFLALSKCMPNAEFLHYFVLPSPEDGKKAAENARPELSLCYDRRWLAICRVLHPYMSYQRQQKPMPTPGDAAVIDAVNGAEHSLPANEDLDIRKVQQFTATAPPHADTDPESQRPLAYRNPQTDAFCRLVGIPNTFSGRPSGAASTAPSAQDEVAQIQAAALERKRKREQRR